MVKMINTLVKLEYSLGKGKLKQRVVLEFPRVLRPYYRIDYDGIVDLVIFNEHSSFLQLRVGKISSTELLNSIRQELVTR